MNERIKDFYDQVGLDFENFQRVTVTKGDMEKFAELIVRECVYIARQCYTVRAVEAEDVAKHIEETFRS
jgi:hypothetical protein